MPTIHNAQGVSANTTHGILTGQESRQQLYTMLTRGRDANHLYLQVVGDGDPHTVVRPESVAPRTPTESLQEILARDDSPTSATSTLRDLNDPATRLFDAVRRYTDGLQVAAEQIVGSVKVGDLDRIDKYIPGLTEEPAWPTLRAHLLSLAAQTDVHPLSHLGEAARGRDLSTAGDMAAVLDWRLPETTTARPGPLPWLTGIPTMLHDHPVWGAYLAKRSQLVVNLADDIRDEASQAAVAPRWLPQGSHPSAALLGEIAVWRAANGIDPQDMWPTGADPLDISASQWKRQLDLDLTRVVEPPSHASADQRLVPHDPTGRARANTPRLYRPSRPNLPFSPRR
jgi:hypothetical protein